LTGYYYGARSTDFLTVKYDSSGNFIWAKTLGARLAGYGDYGETAEFAEAIAADEYGNLYVAGWTGNGTDYDFLTVKYGQLSQFALPIATINGTPASPTNAVSAALNIGGAGVVSYKYKLDAGAYSTETPVATLISLSALSEGMHTVSVIGKDSAGNWQVTATAASWSVDLTPPTATISGTPESPTNSAIATLAVGGTDVVAYKYKLDSGTYSGERPVSDQIVLSALSEGMHTVSVIGKDSAANWQVTPTIASWNVALPVSIPGIFMSIQEAYNALLGDNILQIKGISFVEDLDFNRNLSITLRGGFDQATGTSTGFTYLHGTLVISNGTVAVENMVLM
jgi:hypothetical protein